MKTEAQIRFSIELNRQQVPLSDFRCGMITALEWTLTPWPDPEPNPDIDHEPELTPRQTVKLFRALEWAGFEGINPRQRYCLVCGGYKPDSPNLSQRVSGHVPSCIYAEVFYK